MNVSCKAWWYDPSVPHVTFPLPLPRKHILGAPLLHLNSSILTSKLHTMESSFVSINGSLRRVGPTRCFCGRKLVVVVSWTTNNPGRRFYGYPNIWLMSNTKGKFCFFYYYAAILVRILTCSIFDFIFRLDASVNFSNDVMMKYVGMAQCLSQSKGK